MKNLTEKELLGVNGGTLFHVWDDWTYEIPDAGCDPYLPEGEWESIFTGETVSGCGSGSDGGSGGGSGSGSSTITCFQEGRVTVVNNKNKGGACRLEP